METMIKTSEVYDFVCLKNDGSFILELRYDASEDFRIETVVLNKHQAVALRDALDNYLGGEHETR